MARIMVVMISLLVSLCSGQPVSAQNWDIDLLKKINPQHPNSLYWRETSSSAYIVPSVTVAAQLAYGLFAKDPKSLHNGYESAGSLAITTVIAYAFKISINRERPGDRYPGIIHPYGSDHGQSFPSGHTSLAFASATSLALEYRKWYVVVPAFLWAGSVGYSRMYLGAHYPSDVLGGAVAGIGSGLLSHYLRKKLFTDKR